MQPNEPQQENTSEQPAVQLQAGLTLEQLEKAVGARQTDEPAVEEPTTHQVEENGPTPLPDVQPVQWQAPEYTQHDKSPIWYIGFVLVVAILMGAAILLMQTWTFAILVPVMAVALIVYSHRPPRLLNYVLSQKGIYINDQLHPLGEFKSFGVIQDQTANTLVLIPTKRFRPALSVFFPNESGEEIVDLLGGYLPMEDAKHDLFDVIVRKLHI